MTTLKQLKESRIISREIYDEELQSKSVILRFEEFAIEKNSISQQIQNSLMNDEITEQTYHIISEDKKAHAGMSPEDFENKRKNVALYGSANKDGTFNKTNPKAGIHAIAREFGPADATVASEDEIKKHAEETFAELDRHTPETLKKVYSENNKRRLRAGLGDAIHNTTKGDTAANVVGKTKDSKNGFVSAGMTGNASVARHYTQVPGTSGEEPHHWEHSLKNACIGKTADCATKSCLWQQGHGKMATTLGHRDVADAQEEHSAPVRRSTLIRMHQQLNKENDKEGVLRCDIGSGKRNKRYGDAVAKSFGPNSERVKSGTHTAWNTNDYSKDKNLNSDANNGKHITESGKGSLVLHSKHEKAGQINTELDKQHDDTLKHKNYKTSGYFVMNKARPTNAELADKTHPKTIEYHADMKKLEDGGRVTEWDKHPSEPNERTHDSETGGKTKEEIPKGANPREYDHPHGYGRTIHNGKSYFYQDRAVSKPHKLTTGEEVHAGDTDARLTDEPNQHIMSAPDEHGGQHEMPPITIAHTTAGTKDKAINSSGMFYDTKNTVPDSRHPGKFVHQINHPKEVEEARKNTRRIIPIGHPSTHFSSGDAR